MEQITDIMKGNEEIVKGEATLDGRVSNIIKDGNSNGPPMLFRHKSMQKIRHCCQNLNLFPYLLYSVDNSKSHPIARKVNICLDHLLKGITERIFFLYQSVRLAILSGICGKKKSEKNVETLTDITKPQPRFRTFEKKQKRKPNPFLLTLAVYLAPLVLIFQLVGLCSLMIFGKYTPGYIFLVASLMFLGCIKLTIVFRHGTKCEKKKVQ